MVVRINLIFAYLARLLTLVTPCVLPVLPIVLALALQAQRLGPVTLAGGMAGGFVVLGLTIAAAGQTLGLSEMAVAPRRSTLAVLKGDQELGRIVAGTAKAEIKDLMNLALQAATV